VQEALVSGEMIARPLALAIRAIAIECRRCSVSGLWSLVDDVGPQAMASAVPLRLSEHYPQRFTFADVARPSKSQPRKHLSVADDQLVRQLSDSNRTL